MEKRCLSTFLVALLFNIQNTQAAERLFPAAILEKGEADISLFVGQARSSNAFHTRSGWSGTQKLDQTSEEIQFRYGLGESWHVGLALHNNSAYEFHTNYDKGPSFLSTQYQGQRNPELWAKYGFVNDLNSPFSLSGTLKVRPNTTDNGTGSEIASLVGGWNFGDGLKGYTGYTGYFPQDHKNSRAHTISIGAFKTITNNLTLTPEISYGKFEASDSETATQRLHAGLLATVKTGHNTFVRPGASIYQYASHDSKDGTRHWGEVHRKALSVSLYHLF